MSKRKINYDSNYDYLTRVLEHLYLGSDLLFKYLLFEEMKKLYCSSKKIMNILNSIFRIYGGFQNIQSWNPIIFLKMNCAEIKRNNMDFFRCVNKFVYVNTTTNVIMLRKSYYKNNTIHLIKDYSIKFFRFIDNFIVCILCKKTSTKSIIVVQNYKGGCKLVETKGKVHCITNFGSTFFLGKNNGTIVIYNISRNGNIEHLNTIVYENSTNCRTVSVTKAKKSVAFCSNNGHVILIEKKGIIYKIVKKDFLLKSVVMYKKWLFIACKDSVHLMNRNYQTRICYSAQNIIGLKVFNDKLLIIKPKQVVICDEAKKTVKKVTHDLKINDLKTYDSFFITCSNDKSVKIWNYDGTLKQKISVNEAIISVSYIPEKIYCRTQTTVLEISINF